MIVHSAEVTRDSLREEIASLPDACEVIAYHIDVDKAKLREMFEVVL